jgi:hypothetical protein
MDEIYGTLHDARTILAEEFPDVPKTIIRDFFRHSIRRHLSIDTSRFDYTREELEKHAASIADPSLQTSRTFLRAYQSLEPTVKSNYSRMTIILKSL